MNQGLKSISRYLERIEARETAERKLSDEKIAQLRLGASKCLTGNTVGFIALSTVLAAESEALKLGGLDELIFKGSTLIFGASIFLSVYAVLAVGSMPIGKTMRDLTDRERKTIENLLLACTSGFFIGLGGVLSTALYLVFRI